MGYGDDDREAFMKGSSPSNRQSASVGNGEYDERDEFRQAELTTDVDIEEGTELVAVSFDEFDELDDEIPVYSENEAAVMLNPDIDEEEMSGELKLAKGQVGDQLYVPADAVKGADGETIIVEAIADDVMNVAVARRSVPDTLDEVAGAGTPGEWMSAEEYAGMLKRYAANEGIDVDSSEGSIPDSLADGAQKDGSNQFSVRGDRMGSWPDFDPEQVNLGASQGGGRGVVEAEYNGGTVYFADGSITDPNRERAGYRALDSLSVAVPEHEFGAGEKTWSVKREFDGVTVKEAPDEWVERVDREAAVDMFAANVLSGNWDIHHRNVMVNENGDVRVIDLDRAGDDLDAEAPPPYNDNVGGDAAVREAGLLVEKFDDPTVDTDEPQIASEGSGEVYQRSRELSQELLRTGEYERIIQDVAEVDEKVAKHIAKNIVMFATQRDTYKGN